MHLSTKHRLVGTQNDPHDVSNQINQVSLIYLLIWQRSPKSENRHFARKFTYIKWKVEDLRTWPYPKIWCFFITLDQMANFEGVIVNFGQKIVYFIPPYPKIMHPLKIYQVNNLKIKRLWKKIPKSGKYSGTPNERVSPE